MIPSQLTRGILARTRSATLGALLIACLSCGGSPETPITPVTPPLTPTVSLSAGVAAIIVPTGTSAVVSVFVARGGGFAGDVTLSAEGVPTAVTVTFSPSVISAASTSSLATIVVGSGAAGATSSITIRAQGSGVASSAVAIALTVPLPVVPAIALTAGASALNVIAGTSGTLPLSVARSNFSGVVALSIAGLPTGVTATFAPATLPDSSTSSTLTLSVSSATPAVSATAVTVTASGAGVTAQTITFTLTVTAAVAPGFSLSASPASVSIAPGQSATSTVTIARAGGFAGNVTLSVDGAPSGVTTTVSPNPASGTSTVTMNVLASAVAGTYNMSVRGAAAGQLDRTTGLSLTVTPTPGITLNVNGTLTAAAGTVATLPISIGRIGNYAGDVTLAVENLPSGVTPSFAPLILAGGATTSLLSLSVAANASLATTTFTVRASGAGVAAQAVPVALTLVAAQGYTLAATNVTATQGTTGTSTVTIARSGGFAGTVNLSITGLPTGVTPTFTPAAATGTSSSLALIVASSVSAGTYSVGITITGTATGVANVTAPLTLTVVPRPVLRVVGGGAGTGSGRVTTTSAGIDCTITNGVAGGTCSTSVPLNDVVMLQVATGSLVSWNGSCSGAGACAVEMTQDKGVGAVFALPAAAPVIVLGTTKPNVTAEFFSQNFTTAYTIQNGGGGTLQPTLSPTNPTTPWLTDVRVAPDGRSLSLTFSPAGIDPARYSTSFSLASPGAEPVRIDVSFTKSAFPVAGMAATVVRFHRNSAENEVTVDPASNLTAKIDLVRLPGGTKIPAEIQAPILPADQNWLDVSVDQGQLQLRMKKLAPSTLPRTPAGNLPSGNTPGAPIVIKLTTANGTAAQCKSSPLISEPTCQVSVYFDSDEYPRLLLRPWGIVLTPTNPTDSAFIEVQPGKAENPLGARDLLRHDCGNRIDQQQLVVTDSVVRVKANFSALADDEIFQCTVKVRYLYFSAAGQAPRTDSASLLVTVAKPSADAILPDAGDVNIVFAAGSTASANRSITLNNFGPRVISLAPPVLVNTSAASCNVVFAAPSIDGATLGQSQVRRVSLTLGPPSQSTPSVCTTTLRLTSTTAGVLAVDIPITVRRN